MNESFPFPWLVCVVLPAACLVPSLFSQMPRGLVLSPGEALAGLAWDIMHLEGVPEVGVAWVTELGKGRVAVGGAEGPLDTAGGAEDSEGRPVGAGGPGHHRVLTILTLPLPPHL